MQERSEILNESSARKSTQGKSGNRNHLYERK